MSWLITPQQKVPVDPVFSNVSLLLHGDGANGSTTITDSSPTPKTVTAVGNAQISTAQSKFGGSSIFVNAIGDYCDLSSFDDLNFGSANFTVESFVNITAQSGTPRYPSIIASKASTWSVGAVSFQAGHTAYPLKLSLYANQNATPIVKSLSNIVGVGWIHWAVTRNDGTWRLFVNGILEDTNNTRTDTINLATNGTRIGGDGWNGSLGQLRGYIDDLRITKGVARYTADFTPPTAPFPDI